MIVRVLMSIINGFHGQMDWISIVGAQVLRRESPVYRREYHEARNREKQISLAAIEALLAVMFDSA